MASAREAKRRADETRRQIAARDDYLAAQKTYHALNDRSHDDPDLVQARKVRDLAYDRYVEVCHPGRAR